MLPLIPILIGVAAGAGGGAIYANNKKGKSVKNEDKWKYILGGAGLGGLGGAGAGMLMSPSVAAGASGAASAATSGAGAASAPIGTAQNAGLFMTPAGQQNQLLQGIVSRGLNGKEQASQQVEPLQIPSVDNSAPMLQTNPLMFEYLRQRIPYTYR